MATETQAVGITHLPYTVRTDDTPKVRFSATVGEEPEVEVDLDLLLCALDLLAELRASDVVEDVLLTTPNGDPFS